MSQQLNLEQYEDFHETRMELRETEEEGMVRCYGCGHIVPKSETLGGLCGDCEDITEKKEVNQ